ncbi:MAG: NAD(P)/FAD-dependent oxidoreductase [Muribaculaceae bacterium]|nr:NAD(P)/FAD-dependent oxidoreductase [Muribaculaceae bacterium]
MSKEKKHLVIIGGGFAGLNLLRKIDKSKYRVTVIDRNNFHSFPPLFYQVASAGIDPAGISYPLRREVHHYMKDGVRFNLGTVKSIDTENQRITTDNEVIDYDLAVIAAGTTNNFFGIENLQNLVYTLKSTGEAITLRNEVLRRLEMASIEPDENKRRAMLRFVVVGGGPTGVEIAGALGEMKRYIIDREYPRIDKNEISITLIEGADRLLGTMNQKSSTLALKYLNNLMVDVEFGKIMKSYDGTTIECGDGSKFSSTLVIWTAGVTTVRFDFVGQQPEYGRGRRIVVDSYNRVKGINNVYALGDISIMTTDPQFEGGHPQLAQVAIQQACNLAKNLNKDEFKYSFKYNDKGTMATVGRNRAVVDLKHVCFGGFWAWMTWMFIHLISILGARNRLTVLINWIWSYFTYGSSLRMLFEASKMPDFTPKKSLENS